VRYGQIYRIEFYIKDRTMDNVQNCDSYINIASSQMFRETASL
jgi:hypothetical protein